MMEKTASKPERRSQVNPDSMEGLVQHAQNKVGIENTVEDQELMKHLDEVCSQIKDLLSSSFGPKGFNKIIINPVNDIYLTSDGKTILDETDILHPVVTSLKKLADSMDRTCGDGTKTAVLLAASLVNNAVGLINRGIHPTTIIDGYQKALNKSYEILQFENKSVKSQDEIYSAILSASSSKGIETHQAEKLAKIMLESVNRLDTISGGSELDLNDNVKILKKTGPSEIVSLNGIILDEKPARFEMPDYLSSPDVLILNYDLKVDSEYLNPQHNIKMDTFEMAYQFEEYRKRILKNYADKIIKTGADVIFCEGEVDPFIESLLVENNILMFKKMKVKDIGNLSRITGAEIMSIRDDLNLSSLGKVDIIEVKKKNSEHLVYVTKNSQMMTTILIWEPVKYNLEKVEEAADDALNNAAFISRNRSVVTGGGGIEFELSQMLKLYASTIEGKEQLAVIEYANALEEIPRTLADNMGLNPVDSIANLQYYYNKGIDSRVDVSRKVVENNPPVYDSATIKKLAIISATETANNILRIDKIVPKW